ncbi:MAG: hypothetical protein IT260_22205 [Saprospiraceae bacterium]|nr:hypothetical protein [Saprospiraceae bacterium]
MKKILIVVAGTLFILFFLLSNLTIVNDFLPNCTPFKYCSDQCAFQFHELDFKRILLKDVEKSFAQYKVKTNQPDLVLYRRFHRKWWQIWNWVDFLTNPRWSIPYAGRDEDT